MKKVYKNKRGEIALTELYDKQLKQLNILYEDLWVDTRFGKAHLIKSGKLAGKPLLLFHGGNSTTPYYLTGFMPLLKDYCIYAVDTVGHPGKSAQICLSHKSMEYGEWASDVINGLGFEKMYCMGGSFGGGILVKLMCVAPEKIEKAVLLVPSGISNASTFNVMMKMGMPMLFYIITKKDYWLRKAIIPMAIEEKYINANSYEMVKNSFEHVAVKVGMPSNAKAEILKCCSAPVLLIAAEKDCMFPGERIIKRAKRILPNVKAYLLNNQGHLCVLPNDVLTLVNNFINE